MKYLLILERSIVFLLMVSIIIACGGSNKEVTDGNELVELPVTSGETPEVFNKSLEKLLASYYSLKDALVDYDTTKANHASSQLALDSEGLLISELINDSTGVVKETAKSYANTISGSARAFVNEMDREEKKKEFRAISDALYDLVRTVRYGGQKIYHQHCPMAFNDDSEGYWLSNDRSIVNPYLGKKHPKYKASMLECGDLTDSIGASRAKR